MKTIFKALIVLSLSFLLMNGEPPRKQAIAEVPKPVAVKAVEKVITQPPSPTPTPTPVPEQKPQVQVNISGDKASWLAQSNIPSSEWGNVDYIISRESSWNPLAKNYLGCLGLGQSCPGSKVLNACPDLNPVCQLNFFYAYMVNRYGSAGGAVNFWVRNHWY